MASGFDGNVHIKHMTPLVAVAMVQQCDPDLTKVTYFATRPPKYWEDAARTGSRVPMQSPQAYCLRCAFTSITGRRMADTPEDWVERMIDALTSARYVITAIDLYSEGEECPACRKFP